MLLSSPGTAERHPIVVFTQGAKYIYAFDRRERGNRTVAVTSSGLLENVIPHTYSGREV